MAKEVWQMTKEEYSEYKFNELVQKQKDLGNNNLVNLWLKNQDEYKKRIVDGTDTFYYQTIKRALESNLPVPDDVIKDFNEIGQH